MNAFAQLYEQWSAYPGFHSSATGMVIDYKHNKTVYAGGSINYSPSQDFIVLCYDSNGVNKWNFIYNDSVWAYAHCIGIGLDTSGNIYATGMITGYSSSQWDIFTLKLDTAGNLIWTQRFNGTLDTGDYAEDLVVTPAGDVYVTGYTNGPNVSKDLILLKYTTNGALAWSRQVAGAANASDRGQHLELDSHQNIVVAGYITESFAYPSLLVTKYDSTGSIIWDRRYNGADSLGGWFEDMQLDAGGNIYFPGSIRDTSGGVSFAIHKFDSTGNLLWVTSHDYGNSWESAKSVLIGADGYVYVTGSYDCGAGCFSNVATMKLDTAGNVQWDVIYDTLAGSDAGEDVGVDENGNVYVVGTTHGISVSLQNITILTYDSTGSLIGETRETSYGYGTQIIVNASDDIYVMGTCARNAGWTHAMILHYADTVSTVSIDEHSSGKDILIAPNPSAGLFTINTSEVIQTVAVYNLTGQPIELNANRNYIDLSDQPAGCYYAVIMFADGSVQSVRLVKN